MPGRAKRVSLVQEVVRILRNTKEDLPAEVKNNFLSEFSLRMKLSGYSEQFRYEVISSGVTCYEKQLARAAQGTCPLYRPKGYKEDERRRKKMIKKRSWMRPFSTVLFCPPTPNSELAKSLRKIAEEETKDNGWSVKVIERAGIKLQHQVPGLKEPTDCGKDDCFLHKTGGQGDCRKEGLVYKGTCLTCIEKGPSSEVDWDGNLKPVEERNPGTKSIYWGETSYGAYIRGKQHIAALEKPKSHQENAFVRHREDFHRGEESEVNFKFERVRNFARPMNRIVSEGCHIQSTEADICMNGKLDHFKPGVGKVVVTNKIHTGRRRRTRNTD